MKPHPRSTRSLLYCASRGSAPFTSGFVATFLAVGLATGLIASLTPSSASARVTGPCESDLPPVDVGLRPLAFLDTGSSYRGYGSAATIDASEHGLDLWLQERGALGDAADLSLSLDGGEISFRPADGASGPEVTTLRPGAFGSRHATTSRLLAGAVYPGVSLEVSATHRRLTLRFEAVDAEHLAAVRLEADSDVSTSGSRARLSVSTLGESLAGTRRAMTLQAFSPDDRAARFVRHVGAQGSVALGLEVEPAADRRGLPTLRAAEPVTVVVTALLGPYRPAIDAEAFDSGTTSGALALSPVRLEAGSPRRGALVQHLDADGETIAGAVIDAGGDLDARGLAADPYGRVLIAGGVKAQETEPGGAWLAAVDLESGELVRAPELPGLLAADDVSFDADGALRVIARGFDTQDIAADRSGDFVLSLPARDALPEAPRVAVATVDADLVAVHSIVGTSAPAPGAPLRAWRDCHGQVQLGAPSSLGTSAALHTYQIDVSTADMQQHCPRIGEGFGFELLCWKARISQAGWTHHPANVAAVDVPRTLVFLRDPSDPNSTGTSDHVRLDQLEANQHGNLFFHLASQTWGDPGGSWIDDDSWAYSKAELAVAAALFQERWNSPIAANLRVTDGNAIAVRAAVLRAETFSASSPSQMPHEVCDEDADNDGNSDFHQRWPRMPEAQVAAACVAAHASDFTLESIEYDTWQNNVAWRPNQTVQGAAPGWWTFYSPYVGDPPDAALAANAVGLSPAHLREMSQRLAERLRVRTLVETTTWRGGQVVEISVADARVAADAID